MQLTIRGGLVATDKKRLLKAVLFFAPAMFLLVTVWSCDPVVNMTRNGEYYLMSGDYYKAID